MTTPGTTPGVAWYAKVFKRVRFSMDMDFQGVANEVDFPVAVGFTMTPDFNVDGAGHSPKTVAFSMDMAPTYSLPGTPGVVNFNMAMAFTAAALGRIPAEVAFSMTPTFSAVGGEHYARTAAFAMTPAFGATAVGNNGVNPVTYASATAGITDQSANPFTFNITTATNDDVLVWVAIDRQTTSPITVSVGGNTARRVGILRFNGGNNDNLAYLAAYLITNVASGSLTVSVGGASLWATAQAVAYAGVGYAGLPKTTGGTGTSPSQAVTLPQAGAMLAQAFASYNNFSATTGGTNRAFRNGNSSIAVNDSSTAVTIGNTLSASNRWGGMVVPLLPVALAGPRYNNWGGNTSPVNSAMPASYTVDTAAGDYVFVDVIADRTGASVSGVTCAGAAMTLVDSQTYSGASGNATIWRYRTSAALGTGGSKTIVVSGTAGSAWWVSGAVSLSNVTSISTTTKTSGSSSGPSHAVTCAADQLILQTFALLVPVQRLTNGICIYDANAQSNVGMSMNLADASATMSLANTSVNWASMATVIT